MVLRSHLLEDVFSWVSILFFRPVPPRLLNPPIFPSLRITRWQG